jgi:outer membrane protein assembly factor BamA
VLKVVVEENPTVKRIVFKGNKDLSEKELLPIFEAQLGKPQNIEMIGKAIEPAANISASFDACSR